MHTKEDGDREFSFYRNPGADMMLSASDVDLQLIRDARIFHFGTLTMTHEGCREATKLAVRTAREAGNIISFDPNLREPLWDSLETAREQVDFGLRKCHILKISDIEILWFTKENDYDKAIEALRRDYDIPLILLSMGKDGSRALCEGADTYVPAFINPATVETTGAGDTFCASVLSFVLDNWDRELKFSQEELTSMLRFANAAASIITTRKGALMVMPSPGEIQALLTKHFT